MAASASWVQAIKATQRIVNLAYILLCGVKCALGIVTVEWLTAASGDAKLPSKDDNDLVVLAISADEKLYSLLYNLPVERIRKMSLIDSHWLLLGKCCYQMNVPPLIELV